VLYLHGFASSPSSTKAAFFKDRLEACGATFHVPDLNEPGFSSMTLTRMLGQVDRELAAGAPAQSVVFGSSLGGTLAILAAERWPDRIERLVLMAPAVMFAKPGHHLLPPEKVEEWRREGSMRFFHFAYGEERALEYAFYDDSLAYDAFHARFNQPALVFQGTGDTLVDYRTVEAFAAVRPNVTLSLLQDDHQLTASLPRIWDAVMAFLGMCD
jgi:pimeloyl-ACP methyl ester carboxylesterase